MPDVSPIDDPVFGAPLAAGVAVAEAQPDGTIVVDDVPLFSEIRPTDPGVTDGVRKVHDRTWLETAVTKTRERIALGKRPIMTLRHYFDAPERVGTYEPVRVGDAVVNPGESPRATVFGRKVYEDRTAFEKAKGHDFRSIEISPDAPDEFSALALLRDREPYHKYPNLREKLREVMPAEAYEGFVRETFRARAAVAPQVWRGQSETFGAANPYAVANSMLDKGEITKARFDDVVSAIKREDHASPPTGKEDARMAPEAKPAEKSLEDRFEAMASKCFEGLTKKFEAAFAAAMASGKPGSYEGEGDKASSEETAKQEKAVTEDKADTKKEEKDAAKPEAAEAQGPNGLLPPAVSQARPATTAHAPEAFAARLATQEQTILGLRAVVERLDREKKAVAIVDAAKKKLLDMGAPTVSDAFASAAFQAAVTGGQPAVDGLLESVKLGMGLITSAPEAFGVAGSTGAVAGGSDDELKKAEETYASRPENKHKIPAIREAYASWRGAPDGFRRSLKDGFVGLLRGLPAVNDGWQNGSLVRG
jgi:hypothetical protein